MAERTAIEDAVMNGEPSASPPGAGLVFCTRCAANVTALPALARFCNRCGTGLPERCHHAAPLPAAAASPASVPVDPEPFQPPLILVAYAKALFNLGCRYETALGSRRNLEEAARCYWKAARLGDAAAQQRFGAEAVEAAVLPYHHPPPLPGGGRALSEPSPPFATVYRPGIS